MKVKELIETLKCCSADCDVVVFVGKYGQVHGGGGGEGTMPCVSITGRASLDHYIHIATTLPEDNFTHNDSASKVLNMVLEKIDVYEGD